MDFIRPLAEVRVNVKFWTNKGDVLKRCERAGVNIRHETESEYKKKREDQLKDGQATGIELERYGRRDAKGNIILDPGVQILSGEEVKIANFRRDLEEQNFKLVEFDVLFPFGGKPGAALFVSTYSKLSKPVRKLNDQQRSLQDWFFSQIFGHLYVWRNFGGAQFDIPCVSMHGGREEDAIQLRLYSDGRVVRVGSTQVIVAFEGDESMVST